MSASATVTCYDSAAGEWPIDGDGEGAYLLTYVDAWGGWYNGTYYATNFELAGAKHPKAWRIQLASRLIVGQVVAGYDCEPGCLGVEQVCALANHDCALGRRPFIYGSTDTLAAVRAYMARYYTQFEHGVDYWLADPDGVAQIPPGYIAKQYHWGPNTGPESYDTSVVLSAAHCLQRGDPK